MNKKASENITQEELIFLILNIVLFGLLLFFVVRVASGDAITEEKYAKAIALAIDDMQPGTEIRISLDYLNERAKKNKITQGPVIIEVEKNLVRVIISKGQGYSFNYFSEVKEALLSENKKILTIKT